MKFAAHRRQYRSYPHVARHVKREVDAGHDVAVVVSAMAGKTNELVEWCRDASPMHDAREYDAVVASGEQVTSGLLAIALQGVGVQARSWQGWQIPIKTRMRMPPRGSWRSTAPNCCTGSRIARRSRSSPDSRASTRRPAASPRSGAADRIPRGGNRRAIRADRCDIYTDVDGVYTTDPRVFRKPAGSTRSPSRHAGTGFPGCQVLQVRSVELGMCITCRFSFAPVSTSREYRPHANQPRAR